MLIFVAGTWYLLAMMISVNSSSWEHCQVSFSVELVVSWTVWSHHLLSDQAQPAILKVVSGEMVTAFELITQGSRSSTPSQTSERQTPENDQ